MHILSAFYLQFFCLWVQILWLWLHFTCNFSAFECKFCDVECIFSLIWVHIFCILPTTILQFWCKFCDFECNFSASCVHNFCLLSAIFCFWVFFTFLGLHSEYLVIIFVYELCMNAFFLEIFEKPADVCSGLQKPILKYCRYVDKNFCIAFFRLSFLIEFLEKKQEKTEMSWRPVVNHHYVASFLLECKSYQNIRK